MAFALVTMGLFLLAGFVAFVATLVRDMVIIKFDLPYELEVLKGE